MTSTVRRFTSALVAVSMVMMMSGPPVWADPSGTVTLASGDSAYSEYTAVEGASSSAIVARFGSQYVLLTKGRDPVRLDPPAGDGWSLSGSLLVSVERVDAGAVVHYRSVDGSISGARPEAGASEEWPSFTGTPDGWVRIDRSAQPAEAFTHVKASNGARMPLGSPQDCEDVVDGSVGDEGLALLCHSGDDREVTLQFRRFDAQSPWTSLGRWDWDGSTNAFDEGGLFIEGQDVLRWSEGALVRYPTSGGTPRTYPLPPADLAGRPLAVTKGWLGVLDLDTGVFATIPRSGARWVTSKLSASSLTSDGTSFIIARNGDPRLAGTSAVLSLESAASTPVRLLTAPSARLQAAAVALAPGRVEWSDDSAPNGPVWSRTIRRDGDSLDAAAPTRLMLGAAGVGLSASGRRTLSATAAGTDEEGNERYTTVVNGPGLSAATVSTDASGAGQISGSRVLVPVGQEGAAWLVDLATGNRRRVTLDQSTFPSRFSLWGDTIAYIGDYGYKVRVRSLSKGTSQVVNAAPDQNGEYSGVSVWGDYVAWTRQVSTAFGSGYTTLSYRNFRTMGPTTRVKTPAYGVVLTGGYAVFSSTSRDDAEVAQLAAIRLGTSTVIPLDATVQGDDFAADGPLVAWVDGTTGEPKIAPLPAYTDPPRYLGNPFAPKTVTRGATWSGEWVVTKALPTCTLTISSGRTTVRTFDCATKDGSALAAWNTRDSSGALVPAGTYTWTLTGSDADGALRNVDGTATPITGTVKVVIPTATVKVARAGYGNKLYVNVNPNRGSGYWTFRVQERTTSGSWSTLPTTYRTKGNAETRTLTLGAGVFRVKVAPKYGYQGATSTAVRLVRPTVKVTVRAVSNASRLFVNVDPNKGAGYWTFQVQYRRHNGTWWTLPTTYKTFGRYETNTLNLRKGTYRVKGNAKYGYARATSTAVGLVR